MMNFFGKKKKQQDAIEHADQLMNKGLSGLFMKGLVPKEHREQINQSLNSARQAKTSANGGLSMAATAVVISVTDTGKLVNFDPIVVLVLDVTEVDGTRYPKTLETLVSKLQIPRTGDTVGLGSNPVNPSELIYMGLVTL
ncbi:hypothetical protein [Paenibacillus polymyxa]|uniref:hypothetical protein n=1 Tax=Paenibacillus polymyxa TaxID=1406 RepID=UPI002AB4550E|nr:hypothetical protein [Paenibacillus polymyxa]MDY8021384.1 hypothetical protein [Paenibacillus polymyxa]